MERREKELADVEERVTKLRSTLQRRREKKRDILDLQMEVLLNEADGLGFFGGDGFGGPGGPWALQLQGPPGFPQPVPVPPAAPRPLSRPRSRDRPLVDMVEVAAGSGEEVLVVGYGGGRGGGGAAEAATKMPGQEKRRRTRTKPGTRARTRTRA